MYYSTEQEAIEALTKDAEENGVEFNGQNCNDWVFESEEMCEGWFGGRRCQCGNRRITVYAEQTAEGQWYAYAEAY